MNNVTGKYSGIKLVYCLLKLLFFLPSIFRSKPSERVQVFWRLLVHTMETCLRALVHFWLAWGRAICNKGCWEAEWRLALESDSGVYFLLPREPFKSASSSGRIKELPTACNVLEMLPRKIVNRKWHTMVSLPSPHIFFLAARSYLVCCLLPLWFSCSCCCLLSLPSSWGSLRLVFLALCGFAFLPAALFLVCSHCLRGHIPDSLLSVIWKPWEPTEHRERLLHSIQQQTLCLQFGKKKSFLLEVGFSSSPCALLRPLQDDCLFTSYHFI